MTIHAAMSTCGAFRQVTFMAKMMKQRTKMRKMPTDALLLILISPFHSNQQNFSSSFISCRKGQNFNCFICGSENYLLTVAMPGAPMTQNFRAHISLKFFKSFSRNSSRFCLISSRDLNSMISSSGMPSSLSSEGSSS